MQQSIDNPFNGSPACGFNREILVGCTWAALWSSYRLAKLDPHYYDEGGLDLWHTREEFVSGMGVFFKHTHSTVFELANVFIEKHPIGLHQVLPDYAQDN